MTGLSFEYILRHDSKPPHCSDLPRPQRMNEIEDIGYASEYAEGGYTQPTTAILFGNWNYFSKKAADLLEQAGYELEWSDEWDTCDSCQKAVRTQPDCYGWQPFFIIEDGSTTCLNCIDWPELLEKYHDNADFCVPSSCDPAQYGYQLLSKPGEFETGFHHGQTDKAHDILKKYNRAGQYYLVFRIADKGQFDITWEVWQKVQPPAKKHYIAMNGSHGCLPDSCSVSLDRYESVSWLEDLLELEEGQVTELTDTGSVECTPEQGAQYCEVVTCSCQSPWEHEEQSGGEKRFRDDYPEFFEEVPE